MYRRTNRGIFLTIPLATGALVGLTLVTAPPSTAARETCRGEAATIVGSRDADLKGTPERDVVVTNDASWLETYGGDDLICITGRAMSGGEYDDFFVDSGAGNDIVDGTAAIGWHVSADLGEGADRFDGGSGDDSIRAGATGPALGDTMKDTEVDVIATGAGNDHITSGEVGKTNADVIDAGVGDDTFRWAGSGSGRLQGDEGIDTLYVELSGGETALDAAAGRLTPATTVPPTTVPPTTVPPTTVPSTTVPLEWTGMERYGVDGVGDLTFAGTPGDDYLSSQAVGRLRASMGDGNDQVHPMIAPGPGSDIQGGAGRDTMITGTRLGYLGLNMNTGLLTIGATTPYVIPAASIEDTHLMAKRVDLTGNDEPNRLWVLACGGTVKGGAGDDSMEFMEDGFYDEYEFRCGKRKISWSGDAGTDTIKGSWGRDRIDGGADGDRMFGRSGNDILYGGSGLDSANGGGGRDRCLAEQRTSCERR